MATRLLYSSLVLAHARGQRCGRVLWALLLVALFAPAVDAQQISFGQYAQQDGLSNLSVTALLQDRDGFIWVGPENGLFRHDSYDFKRFGNAEGLEDTYVHSILEDSAGRLWGGESHDLYLRATGSGVAPCGRMGSSSVSITVRGCSRPERTG